MGGAEGNIKTQGEAFMLFLSKLAERETALAAEISGRHFGATGSKYFPYVKEV